MSLDTTSETALTDNGIHAATDRIEIAVNRDEAELVLDGLRMLSNCRRYSFKEGHESIRQLHGELLDLIARIETRFQRAVRT